MHEIGVIHGRFQGLHLGHIEYLMAGKAKCKHLIVGITNYDPGLNVGKANDYDIERNKIESNPFTYYERYKIIEGSLLELNINRSEFDIVPFPIESPERIKNFVPQKSKFFITIYDDWGKQKESILKEAGYDVEVMWVRDYDERFSRGSEVREKIRKNEEWKHLVPKFMYEYTINNGIDKRIRENKNIF